MMLILIVTLGGIGYVILNQMVAVVNELPAYRETIHARIEALHNPGNGALGRAAQSVTELNRELTIVPGPAAPPAGPGRAARIPPPANPVTVRMVEAPANALDYVRGLIAPFIGPVATVGIILIFAVFLLVEEVDLRNRLIRLAGLDRLNKMTEVLDDATRRVSRYLLLQFLVNAGFGIICGFGMYLIGVPYAALWGAVAGLLRVVPYLGTVVAGLLPLLLSLAVFDGWVRPLVVLLFFLVLELLTGNFLEPLLYGAHTGISSLALLLTTIFWTTLWGPAGLILSTPLTVCVVVLGRHVAPLSFLHTLLGDQPVLEHDAQLYQRLLALDDFEARALVAKFRATHSLVELYDGMIIPALTRAEHDRHKAALEPEREEFLFLNVRDMLAEFGDTGTLPDPAPGPGSGRILCFPANDEADEIAAAMLAQLLEQAGRAVMSFPLGSSTEGMLSVVEPTGSDVFCISSIPPLAFAHARSLGAKLRAKYPRTRILVGIWGYSGDPDHALRRFGPSCADQMVTSLAAALDYLDVPRPDSEVAV
jgi:predicted PurR-regulated permease PerM